MAKAPEIKEVDGVTVHPNGVVIYRIRFPDGVPTYPEGFKWQDGRTYAHVPAGGIWTDKDLFTTEAAFLASLEAEPVEPGMTRLVALLPVKRKANSFHIAARVFYNALNLIRPGIAWRNTIPILDTVRLTGKRDRLALEVTDLDTSFRCEIAGNFPRFDICADYWGLHRFLSVQKTLKALDVDYRIEVPGSGEDPRLVLHGFLFATPAGASFKTMPAGDFPAPPTGDYDAEIDFDPAPIRQIRAAISTEETRYYLNGVYLHAPTEKAEDGTVTRLPLAVVATDGHRLKLARTETEYGGPGVIIPRKLALWLSAQTPGRLSTGKLHLKWEGHMPNDDAGNDEVGSDTLTVFAKLIDGAFPDYTRVLPKDPKFRATLNKQELAQALAMLKALILDNDSVKINFANQAATVSQRSIEANTLALALAGVSHQAVGDSGVETLEIGLKRQYLLDHLATVTGDTVTFDIIDASSPVRTNEGNLTSILMPLRI